MAHPSEERHREFLASIKPRDLGQNRRCADCTSPGLHGTPPIFHPHHKRGRCLVDGCDCQSERVLELSDDH